MKIIASDYDGTINFGGISEQDRAAIAKFRAAGNKFGVNTGRDLEMALWILYDMKGELDFLICCTGGVIKNGEGEIIYAKKGKVGPFLYEMVDKALELGGNFFAVSDVLTKCYVDTLKKIPTDFSALKEFTHSNVGFVTNERAKEFLDYVRKNHSDKISAYQNGWHVDMPPINTSKVTGIYEYAKMVNCTEIYAVGDNVNDIDMIKEFNGFAVSNALDEVKAVAKHQCDRIADMIDYLLGGEDK